MALTKERILELLKTDKRAVARALVVLNERQTSDEQASENTRYLNGRGFRPCHARMGSSMAKFFLRTNYLTDKQVEYWRKPDRTGAMRIGIYWKQLLEAAEQKATQGPKKAPLPGLEGPAQSVDNPLHPNNRDFGNDMEERMVLDEIAHTSPDPAEAQAAKAAMEEIDAFWAKLRGK